MSTAYYLVDPQREREYNAFRRFWEEKLYPGFVKQIEEYCIEGKGVTVSDELETLLKDSMEGFPSKTCLLDDAWCREQLGTYSYGSNGFLFSHIGGELSEGKSIRCVSSLKAVLEAHKELCVEDECGKHFSLEQFCEQVGFIKR